MPKSVRQVTQVVETTEVVFEGVLKNTEYGWEMDGEPIDDWLDRFTGKEIQLKIGLLIHLEEGMAT